jgi:hypothetical protein
MARLLGTAVTGEVSVSAATAKTVLQLVAPTNQRVAILGIGIYFKGTTVTNEPVTIKLERQTTAGTMSSLTPRKVDDDIATNLQTTAQHTATAEPTSGNLLDQWYIHPQAGVEHDLPLGQEFIIGGGDRVGIVITADNAVTVMAKIRFEE